MNFDFISTESVYLQKVLELGKRNSSTLGFMPEGGFYDHAKKKHILIASEEGELVGYILFRISLRTGILSITHLCVADKYRNRRIAIKLLDQLKLKYKNSLQGISLTCREDYVRPSKLWREYGFIKINRNRSRSSEEKYLIKWWYSFNQIDLFSFQEVKTNHSVLLDMNIIIKLRDLEEQNNVEVQSLLADWLADEVTYYFAQEFYNEVMRDSNIERVKQTKSYVQRNFKEAIADRDESNKIFNTIKEFFKSKRINDYSDIRQVADCISADIDFFITLDKDILNCRNKIESLYDVTILSPSEFILKIDMLMDDTNYHPSRLAGATHTIKKIGSESLNNYLSLFLKNDKGEKKSQFENKLNKLIQNFPFSNILTVEDKEKNPIAIWAYTIGPNTIEVNFIRIFSCSIEITLFTQLIFEIINLAIEKKLNFIKINDDYFCDSKINILNSFGFIKVNSVWKKIAIRDLVDSNQLLERYSFINDFLKTNIETLINESDILKKNANLYKIERALYPLKFKDLDIPCYIIPIKRYWAGQLFDKFNTAGDIFGADPNKIWNRENVYYRNVKPVTEEFPARVLWYVSSEKNFNRQKSILATSYIDNVSVDNAKIQFKKFKKFGIYEWSHIYELSKRDEKNPVKVINFSDTEIFNNEINYDKIVEIMLENNLKKNTFVSPVKISNKVFNEIYELALKE